MKWSSRVSNDYHYYLFYHSVSAKDSCGKRVLNVWSKIRGRNYSLKRSFEIYYKETKPTKSEGVGRKRQMLFENIERWKKRLKKFPYFAYLINTLKCSLRTRYCCMHFTNINLYNLNNPSRQRLVLPQFYRYRRIVQIS